LTSDPGDELAPVWSPDGTEVGFVAIAPDGTRSLKAVRLADLGERTLAAARARTSPAAVGAALRRIYDGERR
ncbi:MAG: hypothetical protein QOK21_3161, partial [Solirubrobacteraceae bacterium]|nr:hypothetical protein [Solirubrobacteraceae bacterium]